MCHKHLGACKEEGGCNMSSNESTSLLFAESCLIRNC